MRLIDVLDLQAEDEIEFGTKLKVIDGNDEICIFKYVNINVNNNNGMFVDDDGININIYYALDYEFLNYEAELLGE